MSRVPLRAVAALLSAVTFTLALASGASAAEPWTSVGLTKAYTYHWPDEHCTRPGIVDPSTWCGPAATRRLGE
jgi:hypothetical protein